MAAERGPEGLTDPGPLPTTLTRSVVDEDPTTRAALRAARFRIEELRTAVISAREFFRMVYSDVLEPGATLTPTGEAAKRWMERFSALADPPLAVEVEADDDEDHEPTEGAFNVREEEHSTRVYLRTDGSLEYQIGTISAAEELPVLLHLAADEMVNPRG